MVLNLKKTKQKGEIRVIYPKKVFGSTQEEFLNRHSGVKTLLRN